MAAGFSEWEFFEVLQGKSQYLSGIDPLARAKADCDGVRCTDIA